MDEDLLPRRGNRPPPLRRNRMRWLVTIIGIVAAVFFVALAVGNGPTRGFGQFGLIGLAAGGFAIWFVTLGFTNIERFVVITLIARASLDILKPDAPGDSAISPASLLAVGFIAGAAIWLLSVKPLPKPRAGLVFARTLILIVLAGAISAIGAGNWQVAFQDLVRLLAAVMMFFLVDRLLADTGRPLRIVHAILLAAIVPIVTGFVGTRLGLTVTESKDGVARVISTFQIANAYAYFLTFVGLTALALAVVLRQSRLRWHYAVLAAACAVALVTTNVRTAWIAFAIGALVIGFGVGWRTVVTSLAILTLVVLFVPTVQEQFTALEPRAYSDTISENSFTWRVDHWKAILPLIRGHEITGIGINQTVTFAPDVPKEPHNDYLRSFLEMGIGGLVAFVVMIGAGISIGFRAFRAAMSPTNRAISLAFLAVSIALAVASLTDNLLTNVGVVWYFYALAGCATWCLRESLAARTTPPADLLRDREHDHSPA
jgi:O-antigen ligase